MPAASNDGGPKIGHVRLARHAQRTQSAVGSVALALLAFSAFLGIAPSTYHSADTPSTVVYPPSGTVANACGRSGALVAEMLFRGVGAGAYFVWLSLAVFDIFLLARRPITEPVLRTIGWVMALVGICTFAALAFPSWSGPVIGPGGYAGAAGRSILEKNFAAAGSFVLTLSVILAGVLLSTDYLIFRLSAWCLGKPTLAAARLGQRLWADHRSATSATSLHARELRAARATLVRTPWK